MNNLEKIVEKGFQSIIYSLYSPDWLKLMTYYENIYMEMALLLETFQLKENISS